MVHIRIRRVVLWLTLLTVIILAGLACNLAGSVQVAEPAQPSYSASQVEAEVDQAASAPQERPEAPAEGESSSVASSDPILLGEQLFMENGCFSCHVVSDAGPYLGAMRARFEQEQAEGKHAGHTYESYLRESIVIPVAYVVPGYSARVMPETYEAVFNEEELDALVDYMLALPAGDPERGETLFVENGCDGCHVASRVGSDLSGLRAHIGQEIAAGLLPGYTIESFVRESLVNPSAYIAGGGNLVASMPGNYDEALSDQQLMDIIVYMLSFEGPPAPCAELVLFQPAQGLGVPAIGGYPFSWTPAAEAASYRIEIVGPHDTAWEWESDDVTLLVDLGYFFLEGEYTWTVSALDGEQKLCDVSETFTKAAPPEEIAAEETQPAEAEAAALVGCIPGEWTGCGGKEGYVSCGPYDVGYCKEDGTWECLLDVGLCLPELSSGGDGGGSSEGGDGGGGGGGGAPHPPRGPCGDCH